MSNDNGDDPLGAVEEQASEWIVRQDGGELSPAEQRAFQAWIAVPAHRDVYQKQSAVWQQYRRAGAQLSSLPRPRRQSYPRHSGTRRKGARRKLAASAIAAAVALVMVMVSQTGTWRTWLAADYTTGAGERRTVTLADGSVAKLDGRSAIAFDQTPARRTLRLLEGSAFFTVANDPARPFTVLTEAGSVTALGTAFAVREQGNFTELTVTEHSVRVEAGDGASAVVDEGQGTRFTADRVAPPVHTDVDAATAWTRGKLIVFNRPLGEVVAEIGRQRRGYWTVRGEAAAIQVNGVYDLDHPLAALDALERTHALRSFRLSDRFIVLSR